MRCTASQPIGLLGLLFLLWAGCRGAQPDAPPESVDAFVGDSVCASCHGDIAALYRRTPKAQALYRLAPDRVVEDLSGQEAVYEPRTGFYYRAFRQGDAFFQEEYRLDARGRKTHRLVYPMQYVVGSGNAARTYLYEENGYLFQLPLSWYAQSGRWGLSPGYERTNARFFRPIRQACLGCHTGHFRPVPETSNRYEAFSLGIGCERCHGPGARHVALHRGGKRSRSGPDTTILNPRRIPPERRLDLCQQCHLETTVSFYREGKGPLDYRPGRRLSDYWVAFVDSALSASTVQVASHVERMQQSACFRGSRGRLDCLSCHDAHRASRELGPEHFNRICQGCHDLGRLSRGPLAATHGPEAPCTSCHMPRIRPSAVPHAAFTDHAIPRRPDRPPSGTPPPQRTSGQLTPVFAELRRDPAYPVYEGIAYLAYAREHPETRALERAIDRLLRGLREVPGHAEGWYLLGYAYEWRGERSRARAAYARAAALEPTAERLLALARLAEWDGDWKEAERCYQEALRRQPELPEALTNLGRLLELKGRLAEARTCYEQAVRLRPSLAEARFNLGTLLVRLGAPQEAEAHLRRAVALEPDYAKARNNLAVLLAQTGRLQEAIAEWEEVVRLEPAHADALFNLALAYAQNGRLREARRMAERFLQRYPDEPRSDRLRALLGGSSSGSQ
ncbi:MAG: tetratricopeptide repeat protein [Bacteroidetes bacterium]|nr:tetratricopeptide repeat protein [Rhodothermia bacterium]MCX7907259.1 tetratricopeptide repeat protein [Bacteroidota bacterium]MDW8286133.1 tetratricopeptide repeat protein [Bacteroidota bacterium]